MGTHKLISTYLAQHPDHSAKQAMKHLFPLPNPLKRLAKRFKVKHSVINGMTEKELRHWTARETELKRKAGWKVAGEEDGVECSDLFWKMYLSLMPTMERDPLSGLVPPDLLGSTTTMPLSIISLIPDIIQHYRDVIVRAEKEVFLVTNYWQPSASVSTVTQALKDLSAKVIKSGREKVVVKIMYDRGSWEQLWNAHAPVLPKEWAPLNLPTEEDIPGLDMEVVVILLGTFHAKFLIVDRKVALINSNNIQDRPNLELMTHLEGPIVDSFYEIALHSWYNRLTPMLPCISSPYQPPLDSSGKIRYLFQDRNPYFDDIEVLKAAKAARILLRRQTKDMDEEAARHHGEHGQTERLIEAVKKVVEQQRANFAEWHPADDFEARRQQLREFTKGLGLQSRVGSRSNSRGPSRRGSANERILRTFREETRNALLHADPSEAPSTPTAVSENLPKTINPDTQIWGNSGRSSPSHSDHPFIDTPLRSPGDGPRVSFETRPMITGRLLDGNLVESPTTSTEHLPRNYSFGPKSRGVSPSRNAPVSLGEPIIFPPGPKLSEKDKDVIITEKNATEREGGNDLTTAEPMDTSEKGKLGYDMKKGLDPPWNEESKHLGETIDVQLEDAPKMERHETELPEGAGSRRMFHLSKKFNAGALSEAWATVEDSDELDNFRPHIVHKPHDPFPIAMCCRKPHGFPGHHDIRNPQNAAWLAGMRYAQKRIFIQSPTLNARPIVRGVKQACRRGVMVELLLDLGFNDKGESIPFQGGTNEEVVDRLYKTLKKEGKEQFLKVYWYTGKDQVRPLNAVKKQRNCHIKFAAYDDQVLILGNGNQDSQSWFHSQEINVMIDSKQIVSEMMDQLLSNQNTMQYGLVDTDGVWRDKEGKTLVDYGATGKGTFRGLSAFITFAKSI
ncbi:hypothetical protein TREMEDRAFT_35660 [Tremella mesenterica DSM 1558]|uniref:uncharacterized protein n=1 Tax=Tremella mesenterica (strain ATCC 24925 / CBS 8224 / DSM 1558 / NBRC 9311 / NRRL Y-6157 / RJB 2259-6 / UBC 559-6) TaxID=578456 RepID=UPI00032D2B19|nr:uncharacterized protein TREMEDRAFT_35660 [Tremella mesenterica DSM 1558]EIW65928.1 hypothetical protein TREMEDRAFT_35660 [Tremella mesenterica DSM 1558]